MAIDRKNVGPNNKQIKVLIADRSLLFRSGLRSLLLLEPGMAVIGEAAELADAIAKSRAWVPDILVLDASLACESLLLVREARCPVLWLAPDETDEQLQLALTAGARAYMLRGTLPAELVAGIRLLALTAGQERTGLSKIVPDLQALKMSTEKPLPGTQLTAREREVVRILAEGRTAREVAAELGLSIKTVEAHKLNLMRKLDLHNRASLIAYAIEAGLVADKISS